MIILYKVCFNKTRVNGDIDRENRPYFTDSNSLITVCLTSLVRQLTSNDTIHFFLDGVDSNNIINNICEEYNIKYSINRFNHYSAPKIHAECSLFLLNSVDTIKDTDHIFICEDDYLFCDNAIEKIKDFLNHYPDYFCHPIDYPNLYTENIYASSIIITKNHHWRSIKTTTYTFAFTYKKFKQYENVFCISNEQLFWHHLCNLMYVSSKCFSPLPSLCAHLENNCLPPCFDIEKALC